jgi:hypothetical protein
VAENERLNARVSDEQAASGRRSLKFTDGPGQKHPFNPHVYFRTAFRSGAMVGRFALRLEAKTCFYCQWRDYDGGGFAAGPTVRVTTGGRLVHDGKTLLILPPKQWIRFELTATLGQENAGTFDLTVRLPGESAPRAFRGLSCSPAFRTLDWVGFVANGTAAAECYLDEIEIRPTADSGTAVGPPGK